MLYIIGLGILAFAGGFFFSIGSAIGAGFLIWYKTNPRAQGLKEIAKDEFLRQGKNAEGFVKNVFHKEN